MEIRVKDHCQVPGTAGKTGFVHKGSGEFSKVSKIWVNIGPINISHTAASSKSMVVVMLDKAGKRLVSPSDLEPFIPEEGDMAKCLVWGMTCEVGKVRLKKDLFT